MDRLRVKHFVIFAARESKGEAYEDACTKVWLIFKKHLHVKYVTTTWLWDIFEKAHGIQADDKIQSKNETGDD